MLGAAIERLLRSRLIMTVTNRSAITRKRRFDGVMSTAAAAGFVANDILAACEIPQMDSEGDADHRSLIADTSTMQR